MFNHGNCCGGSGYSLADIAAATGNNGRSNGYNDGCFGGDGAW